MTGATLALKLIERFDIDATVAIGSENAYLPARRMVSLRRRFYTGTTKRTLTIAAHEVGHAAQHVALGRWVMLLRYTVPGRLALEWDASRRARAMMATIGVRHHEQALRDSWRSYVWPAAWRALALVLVLTFIITK